MSQKPSPPLPCWTLFVALAALGCAAPDGTVRIHEIQGAGHRSPLAGKEVRTTGVVTAIDAGDRNPGLWIEDPRGDGDDATSEGLFVSTGTLSVHLEAGQSVEVKGQVEERADPQRESDLTLTRLVAAEIRTVRGSEPLPPPVRLGRDGRRPPPAIDDDGLASFDPASDAIDFYESLEGMRVEVAGAVVVGATSRFGEIVVLAGGGAGVEPRSRRGGVLLAPDDGNPERLLIAPRLLGEAPQVDVGDRFEEPITGVVDYEFGNFRVLPREPLPAAVVAEPVDEATVLAPGERQLTLATFNVYNLSAVSRPEKHRRLAEILVREMASPDVVALQEVQDGNGPEDDELVSAAATFGALIAALEAVGGPRYDYRQIDPVDDADGGQPGANIRVGFLFNPERVGFVDRGEPGSLVAATVEAGPEGPLLTPSPGRVAPRDPAFEHSRKPLAAELVFGGRKIFAIATHLNSKGGDDPLMGGRQPPRRESEERRRGQVRALRELMAGFLALDPRARVVVLGDMNELGFRPPLRQLAAPPWVDLMERIPRDDRYTFNYQGNSQTLDHVVVSPALAERAEIDVVHVNADTADRRRASDHDPVVARLTFG